MIPQFILDNVFEVLDEEQGVYYCKTKEHDGYIVYWKSDNETFHTYRYPPDWWTNE